MNILVLYLVQVLTTHFSSVLWLEELSLEMFSNWLVRRSLMSYLLQLSVKIL